jgi:hypothetical protein
VDELTEQALAGGQQTKGIVRVGQTVRRPLHDRSNYVHALLRHLEAVGFDGAPRLLGIDAQGREVLTYIPGEVVVRSPTWLSDARLDSAARLIRRFHDATAGTALAGDQEVVGHGDIGSHNIVFDGDVAVGIIDWDVSVGPGSRLVDLGHAVWCCADVAEQDVPWPSRPARCGACVTPTAGPTSAWWWTRSATAAAVPATTTPGLAVRRPPPSSRTSFVGWTRTLRR